MIDSIPIEVRVEANNTIQETFKDLMNGNGKRGKRIKELKIDKVKKVFEMLLKEIKGTKNVMNLLSSVLVHDQYTFAHSTNVTVYALAMAMKLNFDDKRLYELGLGSMLHDIGKCIVPSDVLNKNGKLTNEEFDLIKRHTEYGFEILRKESKVPLLSAHCAFQHHEKLDGSGYPRGLKGDEIHPYGKLLAVADVFDALTSHRPYRKAMLPHEAMEILFAETHTHFDEQYIRAFQQSVATYPEGITVKLSTGELAVVVKYQFNSHARPIVRIIQDAQGRKIDKPFDVDLSKELSIMITECDAIMN